MNFPEAKQEFQIRFYQWAGSEWEKEISGSFPNLRTFKSGSVWQTYEFMRRLNKSDQFTLARGLLKKFHPDAATLLGENCTPEEESLRFKTREFFRIRDLYRALPQFESSGQSAEARGLWQHIRPAALEIAGEPFFNDDKSLRSRLDEMFKNVEESFEQKLERRKQAGEKMRFAGKRKLQDTITDKFKEAFGARCVNHTFDDICDPSSQFDIKCCGWIVSTHFWFGRGKALLSYSHTIASENAFEFQGPNGPYQWKVAFPARISLAAWLGISSQTAWEYIPIDEIGPACDIVIKHVGDFFDVAPKLLKGLEWDKITDISSTQSIS